MRKRAIISSIVMAAVMAAGAVGGTIAYFTTQNQTDVNVTSGKISVTSVVSNLATYSLGVAQPAGTFENGGTAVLNDHVLTLDKLTPGDKATFKISVKNESNVKIKYRVAFSKTGDLADALVAEVNGGASEWTKLEVGSADIDLEASIEMPITTGIEYNDKQGSVTILVEAVQGNMPQAVSNASELQEAIAEIPASGGEASIYVENDITLNQVLALPSNSDINLYGNGEVTLNNASGADRVINLDSVENTTLTISGVDVHQGTKAYSRCISLYNTTDCTVNIFDSDLTNDSHYPINVASNNSGAEINIENSTIQGYCAFNIWSPNTVINVKDSTITGVNKSSGDTNAFSVIVFNNNGTNDSTGSSITMDNCVVNSIQQGDQWEAFFIIETNNIAINSTNTVYNYYRLGATQPEVYSSVEEVFDYNSLLWEYNSQTQAIELDFQPIAYQEGDEAVLYPFALMYSGEDIHAAEDIPDTSAYLYGEIAALRQTKLGANGFVDSDSTVNGKVFLMPCKIISE